MCLMFLFQASFILVIVQLVYVQFFKFDPVKRIAAHIVDLTDGGDWY